MARKRRRAFYGARSRVVGLRLIRAAQDLDPRPTQDIDQGLRNSGVPARDLWGRIKKSSRCYAFSTMMLA